MLCGTAGSVIYTASLLAYSAHNVHVRFWLGDRAVRACETSKKKGFGGKVGGYGEHKHLL